MPETPHLYKQNYVITAVVPCYRERNQILSVLSKFDDAVKHIIVVDDACPEDTGKHVKQQCNDKRVQVIVNKENQGVGGATLAGYERALELGADLIVKIDGDGQMDPAMVSTLVRPICSGQADYAKGNRFYRLEGISGMPIPRIIGNFVLSFASKMSSGYWKNFDPTNGFTAIHAKVASILPRDKLARDYFFESDMLHQLNILRAVVADVPMEANYGEETSSLTISKILMPFAYKHFVNFMRRIFYTYFLHDFNIASLELVLGVILTTFGTIYGAINWYDSLISQVPAYTGTIILAALPFLVGSYLLINFLNFDLQNQPKTPLHLSL